MKNNQPKWKTPEYSKREINNAGEIIRKKDATEEEKREALIVVDNWRSSHAYPLHVFYVNLRNKVSSRPDILVVERLKRLDSIVRKLNREGGMKLYRMQDLGGCRMIVPTVDEVYLFSKKIQESRIRHKLKKISDYIEKPKSSGYRSLHLIYRFETETPEKQIYNDYPMLIELQFRTHLQHIWATAVETFGIFTNQALKSGEGTLEIKRFFALVSSLFAMRESCPIVPNTSSNEQDLIFEIEQLDNYFHILDKLRAIRVVIEHDANNIPNKIAYCILRLDYQNRLLKRIFYKASEADLANAAYDYYEKECIGAPVDVVLIRAESLTSVKDAYPNYFLDIGEFISIVSEWIDK